MSRAVRDEGAALVSVLIMTTLMAALAALVVEAATLSLRRTANQTTMEQARWVLLGAEALAASRIEALAPREDRPRIDPAEWNGRTVTFPLDEGVLEITVRDGSNCFNLNSVTASTEDRGLVADLRGQLQLARLLEGLGAPSGLGLSAALTDWIDSDAMPMPGGAEDDAYGGPDAAVRPPNGLIADVGELAAVAGFDAATIARLRPFACVRPTAQPSALNVETLTRKDARLLASVLGPSFSLTDAETVIAQRPAGGWRDLDAFFAHPRIAALGLDPSIRPLFTQAPRHYAVSMRVRIGDVTETSAALIELAGGRARVVRRVFGAPSTEPAV